jgi:hypothetical protein
MFSKSKTKYDVAVRERYLVERADALFSGVGLEVAEDHLLDEQPRPRRLTRRPRRRLRRGGLHVHGHLAIRKCSSERGTSRFPSAARRRRPEARSEVTRPAVGARPTLRRSPSASVEAESRRRRRATVARGILRRKLKWLRGSADLEIWGKFGREIETVPGFRPRAAEFVGVRPKKNGKISSWAGLYG